MFDYIMAYSPGVGYTARVELAAEGVARMPFHLR